LAGALAARFAAADIVPISARDASPKNGATRKAGRLENYAAMI
jgi:hypothetical protein